MGYPFRAALMASASAFVLTALGGMAAAQTPPSTAATTPLDDITVTATKREERVVDTMASVSVRNREEIQGQAPQRIGTVVSQMPGVTTQENPNDPATAINIRGLQDFGRVAVTIDGARQNFQRSGHNANGAFFLDPAFIRMIDITRGPVANIYGSGAIGGVASFETVDPRDVLRRGEKFATELGFSGIIGGRQNGIMAHGIGAIRPTDWASGLIGISTRQFGAYKDGGGNVIADSGQELVSGIGKLVLTPGDGHTIKLSGQLQRYQFANGLGFGASPRRQNDVETSNFVAKYSFSRPDNDWLNLNVSAYRTTTDTKQVRISGTPAQIGNSRYFNIATSGIDINNTSRFDFGAAKLAITYGIDGFQDRVSTQDLFSNGDETTPRGQRSVMGGFIQNHLKYSMIDLIGAMRFDRYELSGNGAPSSSGQRFSPKITLGITPIEGIQPYISYAEGYRAPSITETLVNGPHPIPASFTFLPNPNLRPEIGKTLEAGLNLKFNGVLKKDDAFRAKFSVFQNRVTNFIEGIYTDPGAPCGAPVPGACDDATYTYQNVSRARLRGIEGEIAYDAKRWFATLGGAAIRGDNLITGEALQSVYPDKIALAAGLRFLDEKLVISTRISLFAAQKRLPAATLLATQSKSYGLVDANINYELAKDTKVFIAAENIGDVRYKRYRDGDYSPGFVTKVGLTTRFGM